MGWLVGLPLGLFRLLGGLVMLAVRFAWPILLIFLWRWVAKKLRQRAASGEEASEPAPPPEQEKSTGEPSFHGPVVTVKYREVEPDEPVFSAEASRPQPFGYKTGWLAVRCDDTERVISALGCKSKRPAGWASGLDAVREGQGVFVSPPLDGFVLVIGLADRLDLSGGSGEHGPDDRWLGTLAGQFPAVQFFVTHRVTEYHRWGKFEHGAPLRDYCYAGESGAVLRDMGDWTTEEIALGFGRFPRKGGEDHCEDFPTEENVLDIAAAWGVDPRFEKNTYPPAVGWLCTLD